VRRRLHGRAQAGHAFLSLADLHEAVAEVHAGAMMRRLAREHAAETLGRARKIALVLERNDQICYVKDARGWKIAGLVGG
jgi:hypothetical protein